MGRLSDDRHALTLAELRRDKPPRAEFPNKPRRPLTLVLDGVHRAYNIGAIFRLCDAFLVQRLVICGTRVELHNRKLVQAARGTQRWVPWTMADSALEVVQAAKNLGIYVIAAELTASSLPPCSLAPEFPALLVMGGETSGVCQQVLDWADTLIAIPMLGMANSLNVSTAAAILLYQLCQEIGPKPG